MPEPATPLMHRRPVFRRHGPRTHRGEQTSHVEPSFGVDAALSVLITANGILSSPMRRTIPASGDPRSPISWVLAEHTQKMPDVRDNVGLRPARADQTSRPMRDRGDSFEPP
jgi:hypothetical protein